MRMIKRIIVTIIGIVLMIATVSACGLKTDLPVINTTVPVEKEPESHIADTEQTTSFQDSETIFSTKSANPNEELPKHSISELTFKIGDMPFDPVNQTVGEIVENADLKIEQVSDIYPIEDIGAFSKIRLVKDQNSSKIEIENRSVTDPERESVRKSAEDCNIYIITEHNENAFETADNIGFSVNDLHLSDKITWHEVFNAIMPDINPEAGETEDKYTYYWGDPDYLENGTWQVELLTSNASAWTVNFYYPEGTVGFYLSGNAEPNSNEEVTIYRIELVVHSY